MDINPLGITLNSMVRHVDFHSDGYWDGTQGRRRLTISLSISWKPWLLAHPPNGWIPDILDQFHRMQRAIFWWRSEDKTKKQLTAEDTRAFARDGTRDVSHRDVLGAALLGSEATGA